VLVDYHHRIAPTADNQRRRVLPIHPTEGMSSVDVEARHVYASRRVNCAAR
jgi:hypothetical protein